MENWKPGEVQNEDALLVTDPRDKPTATLDRPDDALNPRIRALRDARDEAERRLQEAILDVESREGSPAFQKAKEIFDDGNRLKRIPGPDGERWFCYGPASVVENYRPGNPEHDGHAFPDVGEMETVSVESPAAPESRLLTAMRIADRGDHAKILSYLMDICDEA